MNFRHYFVATAIIASAQVSAGELGAPVSWYGIVPGISKEPNVIALYGPGRFQDTIGDTGSRTYVSTKDGSTLIFAFGFDKVVERIIWRSAAKRKDVALGPKVAFAPRNWYGWSPALIGGAHRGQVLKWLEKPSQVDASTGQWTYVAFDGGCEGAELTLSWSGDIVSSLEMVAPADE